MSTRPWDDDEGLLAELQAAVQAHQEVPAAFVEAGKAAFAWRQIDSVLAELTYDSQNSPEPEMTGVRGADQPRFLSFAGDGLEIELELSADAVRGQVIPPVAASVQIEDDVDFWIEHKV